MTWHTPDKGDQESSPMTMDELENLKALHGRSEDGSDWLDDYVPGDDPEIGDWLANQSVDQMPAIGELFEEDTLVVPIPKEADLPQKGDKVFVNQPKNDRQPINWLRIISMGIVSLVLLVSIIIVFTTQEYLKEALAVIMVCVGADIFLYRLTSRDDQQVAQTRIVMKRTLLGITYKSSVIIIGVLALIFNVSSILISGGTPYLQIGWVVAGTCVAIILLAEFADVIVPDKGKSNQSHPVRVLIYVALILLFLAIAYSAYVDRPGLDRVFSEQLTQVSHRANELQTTVATLRAPVPTEPLAPATVTLQPVIVPPTALPTSSPVFTQTPMPVSTQQCTVVAVENGVAQWNCISIS